MQSTVELGLGIARLVEVGTDGGKNTDRGTWDPAKKKLLVLLVLSPKYTTASGQKENNGFEFSRRN